MNYNIFNTYLEWLIDQTGQPGYGREQQLMALHEVPFHPIVPGDENREWYGKNLRNIWFEDYGQDFFSDEEFNELEAKEASCLEVLLALATAIYEQSESIAPYNRIGWFWKFIENLGIRPRTSLKTVEKICKTFVDRTYDDHGVGSIFPLHLTSRDQRDIEIWYQMMEYLTENGY